jgi:hypothetical protein
VRGTGEQRGGYPSKDSPPKAVLPSVPRVARPPQTGPTAKRRQISAACAVSSARVAESVCRKIKAPRKRGADAVVGVVGYKGGWLRFCAGPGLSPRIERPARHRSK